eukprot:778753-Pleurochrysis_carterae.AAC.1
MAIASSGRSHEVEGRWCEAIRGRKRSEALRPAGRNTKEKYRIKASNRMQTSREERRVSQKKGRRMSPGIESEEEEKMKVSEEKNDNGLVLLLAY